MVSPADIRVSRVADRTDGSRLILLRPDAPRWLRPFAWFYAILMFFNGMGDTVFTILGRTVPSVTFSRPAPGFLLVAFLFMGCVWLMMRLWQTTSGFRFAAPA